MVQNPYPLVATAAAAWSEGMLRGFSGPAYSMEAHRPWLNLILKPIRKVDTRSWALDLRRSEPVSMPTDSEGLTPRATSI